MTDIPSELRERLTLRYMGDCKCGHCALVPDELVERAARQIEQLCDILGWLNRRGGLGLDVHERIRATLTSGKRTDG